MRRLERIPQSKGRVGFANLCIYSQVPGDDVKCISHCGQRLTEKIVLFLIFAVIILRYVQLLNEFNSYFPKLIGTPHHGHQLPLQAPNTTAFFLLLFPPQDMDHSLSLEHSPRPLAILTILSAQLAPPHPPEAPGHPAQAALSLQGHRDLFPGWPSASPQTPKTAMLPDVPPMHMASSATPGAHSCVTRAWKLPNTSVSKGQSRIPAQPCLT